MLREHDVKELRLAGREGRRKRSDKWIAPGAFVTLREREGCFGMVVARIGEKASVLWTQWAEAINDFSKMVFPVVRRVFPSMVAQDIVSIQPMTAPVGSIFYLDYTYGANSGSSGV